MDVFMDGWMYCFLVCLLAGFLIAHSKLGECVPASKQACMPASQLAYLLAHISPVLNPVTISYRTVPSTI